MKNERFAEYNKYPYDYIIKKALYKEMITVEDHDIIIAYIQDKISKGEIEEARAQRISTSLTQWRRFVSVPYEQMTNKELLKAVSKMRIGKTANGKPYEPGTIRQQIKILKTFTKYLIKNKIVDITRDDLDEIKYPREVFDSVKPKDIPTVDQIEALIGAAVSIRDKAIIGIMVDTGLRPSDVARLTWRDLDFNQQRVKINITTEKTTTPVSCYVILHKSWLEEYRKQRNAENDNEFVFKDSNTGEPITYKAICHMLDRASSRSGFKFPKRARAKLFRATSITMKQRAGFSAAAISKMHFGTPDSKMMRHYSKLDDRDTEREALEKSGAVIVEHVEMVRPETCPNCRWPCSPGIKFCPECGSPVTAQAKAEVVETDDWIKLLPEYKTLKDSQDALKAKIAEKASKIKK